MNETSNEKKCISDTVKIITVKIIKWIKIKIIKK